MTDARWVCRRCFANNTDADFTCGQCGLLRGSEPPAGDQAAQTWVKPPPPRSRWLGLLSRFWWIPVAGLVVGVGYLTTAHRGSGGEITGAGTLQIGDLRVGDCFETAAADEFSEVDAKPCTERHEYELYFVVDWTRGDGYPSDSEIDDFIAEQCLPTFATFVGRTYQASVLDIFAAFPTEDSWGSGDREFQCSVYEPSNAALTASLRGADR